MSRVLVLQHCHSETLGTIQDALESRGVSQHYIRSFEGHRVPMDMTGADGLIVMGGPMGVCEVERYPFLRDEIRLIQGALEEEKPILGVCLGSQLLAASLGAAAKKGKQKEIGWHRIALTESAANDPLWAGIDRSFVACHWHGDIFELPRGAVSLASSDLTACQAFRYGRNAYANLFHMETTEEILRGMVRAFPEELKEAGVDGSEVVREAADHLPGLHRIGKSVFARWIDRLEA